jgi:hypothetical protein
MMMVTYNDQMELSLPRGTRFPNANRPPRRATHANSTAGWWFVRMHELVDAAVDYPPVDSDRLLAPSPARATLHEPVPQS